MARPGLPRQAAFANRMRPYDTNPDSRAMTTTAAVLAAICSAAIIINAVARLPWAIARLVRASIPAVTAVRELRAAISGHGSGCACGSGTGPHDRHAACGRDIPRRCDIGVTVQCAIEFGRADAAGRSRADTMEFGWADPTGRSR